MANKIRNVTQKCRILFAVDYLSSLKTNGRSQYYCTKIAQSKHQTSTSHPWSKNVLLNVTSGRKYCTAPAYATQTSQTTRFAFPGGKPKAVVFDKNGTLIDFHVVWTPWVQGLTSRLDSATGLKLEDKILECLNVCVFTKQTRSGLLAEGSSQQIKHKLETLLVKEGFDRQKASEIVELNWKECDTGDPATLKQHTDLKDLFTKLKTESIKIVVSTADSRKSTEKALQNLDVLQFIDLITCGDDADAPPKHHAESLSSMCRRIGVDPKDVVVVGDTVTDMKMGRQGGACATIGVLSGVGTRLDLVHYADHIIECVEDLQPLLFTEARLSSEDAHRQSNISTKSVNDPDIKASLVIFDKDGTLLCFHSMWTPWALGLADRLVETTGLDLYKQTLEELGFDTSRKKWVPGVFTEGTTAQSKVKLVEMLQNSGIKEEEASRIVEQVWVDGDTSFKGKIIKALDNPVELFQALKKFGVKIAVCTSDDRGSTTEFLESIGAMGYVDMLVCGNDEDGKPKPSPCNALKICEKLGVHPAMTMMIGDTLTDMELGKSAKLGATVAVLSGVGQVDDMKHLADHMVPSIKHVMDVLVPKSHVDSDVTEFKKQ